VNGTVLVTGGSGFVGGHVVLQLLNAGYTVRTTVRSLGKVRNATSAKAQRMLEWKPRSWEEAVTATAESLLKLGVITAKE
jgi:uncharacterized protein YbjT (DUF2867 family)